MRTTKEGFELLKSVEGCKLKAYQDEGGVWTIGYGHTGVNVVESTEITQQRAINLLYSDIVEFETKIALSLAKPVNDNQFSALVIFAFNVGIGAFQRSTLLKKVNAGDFIAASEQFHRWDHVNGVVSVNLTRRRAKEKELFLKPVVSEELLKI